MIILTVVVQFQYFLVQILLRICHWKVVHFPTAPVQCTYLTLENLRNLGITKSAVKEHLFSSFWEKTSYFHFICPWFFSGLIVAQNKCSKCCLSACMHTVSHLVHLSMAGSIAFCCRLPDVNKSLLQLIDRIKLIPIHSKPEITRQ